MGANERTHEIEELKKKTNNEILNQNESRAFSEASIAMKSKYCDVFFARFQVLAEC